MSRELSDLLEVLLLAKETLYDPATAISKQCPLFETVEDLQRAPWYAKVV